ncbi:MAG: GGDEF domain-containing protein [Spirochaetaceae bacterium]|jgi:diguanylate cyclase (GGDEF)-like protein|nr:GGDEF domain-containing protein [Spirochaetaceae bacterium]
MRFGKRHIPLGVKFSLLTFLMTLGMGIAIAIAGYELYLAKPRDDRVRLAENTVNIAARLIDGETAALYHKTGVTDGNYERLRDTLFLLRENRRIQSLYIAKFVEKGTYYIFDADGGNELPLNFFDPWNEGFSEENKKPFLEGREIPPEIYNSNLAGKVFTVHKPLRYRDGGTAAGFYAAVDYSMRGISRERLEYFGIAGIISLTIALVFAFIQWKAIRRSVVRPINVITEAINHFPIRDDRDRAKSDQGLKMSSLAVLSAETGDEIESLATAFKNMEKSIWNYTASFDKLSAHDTGDELTGLYDRKAFYDYLNYFIYRDRQKGEQHALFVFNLDWFKQINETYGHAMGDQVLKSCADSLKQIFRNSDMVARIGGDIFAVLCKNIGNEETIKKKVTQIQEAFLAIKPFYLISGITVSIGIVTFDDGDVDFGELQQKAFLLIDEVKLQGCNDYRIVHY